VPYSGGKPSFILFKSSSSLNAAACFSFIAKTRFFNRVSLRFAFALAFLASSLARCSGVISAKDFLVIVVFFVIVGVVVELIVVGVSFVVVVVVVVDVGVDLSIVFFAFGVDFFAVLGSFFAFGEVVLSTESFAFLFRGAFAGFSVVFVCFEASLALFDCTPGRVGCGVELARLGACGCCCCCCCCCAYTTPCG